MAWFSLTPACRCQPIPTACSVTPCAPTGHGSDNPLNTSTWANALSTVVVRNYSRLIDHGYWGLFVRIIGEITPKLTLNYGLRWDVESGLSAFVNHDYKDGSRESGLPIPRIARPCSAPASACLLTART